MTRWVSFVIAWALMVVATATEITLEYPYAQAVGSLATQVTACANVSGFSFQTNTTPTAMQLSHMCADPNCGRILSQLLKDANTKPTSNSSTSGESVATAFRQLAWPMLNFCWFGHLPQDHCPEEFILDFFQRFQDKLDACATNMNFSLADPTVDILFDRINSFTQRIIQEKKKCPRVCNQVAEKLLYAIHYRMLCPRTHGALSDAYLDVLYRRTAAIDMFCIGINPQWPSEWYAYQEDWPLPIVRPEVPNPSPVIVDSSGSNDHDADERESIVIPTSNKPTHSVPTLTPEMTFPPKRIPMPTPTPSKAEEETSSPPLTTPPKTTIEWVATSVPTPISTSPVATGTLIETTLAPVEEKKAVHVVSDHRVLNSVVSIGGAVVLCLFLAMIVRTQQRRFADSKALSDESASYTTIDGHLSGSNTSAPSNDTDISQWNLMPGLKQIPVGVLRDIRLIGMGGHGVVYLVRDTRDGCRLAAKRLTKNRITTEKIAAFVSEIQLVATLDHPCIVSFVGASWTNRVDVQALFEYMEGGDLRSFLDKTSVESWSARKLDVAIDIADALAYVHTAFATPIVHRDLKSRNVLLNKSRDRAKLSDFGVARNVSQNSSMTTGVGTSRWLAPEVIIGGGDYNAACDIYSFGVVLSELDTHRVPFSDYGEGLGTFMPEITILTMVGLEGLKPTFSNSCPPSLFALAQQCLSHEPADRPTAAQMAEKLREFRSEMMCDTNTSDRCR